MDWVVHPDGGMWMNCKKFIRVRHVSVSRCMLTGEWRGAIYIVGGGFPISSMDFGEVITHMEITINLLESQ